MGMAASQARLLSITSRMADNELRAQIINNSKMRLATESSKVSEEYVNALNSATMMISNYDAEGNSQYQQLSFNALTAYSSQNNQYGLVNANGKLLVSEKDANIFKQVQENGGDLDDFLAQYGLEYKSTYFTSETLGAEIINFEDIDEEYSINDLVNIYEGNNGHIGYNNALNSSAYLEYSDYYNEFVTADELLNMEISTAVNNDIFENDTWKNALNGINSASTMGAVSTAVSNLTSIITNLKSQNKISETYADEFLSELGQFTFNGNSCTVNGTATVTQDGNKYKIGDDPSYPDIIIEKTQDENGETIYNLKPGNENDDETSYTISPSSISGDNLNFTYTITESYTEEDQTYSASYDYQYNYKIGEKTASTSFTATGDEQAAMIASLVKEIYLDFQASVVNAVNKDIYTQQAGSSAQTAKKNYDQALEKLANFIFNTTLNGDNWATFWNANKSKIEAEAMYFSDPAATIQIAKKLGFETSANMDIIKEIYIMDTLFETYGEPAWGWVDKNDPKGTQNAEAKAQWYTNLYNRMQDGYKVLEDGLASSNEWIQYALENGIVTMEQVDKSNNWTSTIYSNCSDITEVTDDVAVTRAEAEYNKAMNSIENKDKRYDMELKNIDTEHNSLQTEYDSVKSVIDKNIERSFKMYS